MTTPYLLRTRNVHVLFRGFAQVIIRMHSCWPPNFPDVQVLANSSAVGGVQMKVLSVKTDLRYWPCWELKMDPATAKWRRTVLTTPQAFARSSCGGGLAVPKDAAKTET